MTDNLPAVQFDPSVPAHLRLPAFLAVNDRAVAGISAGVTPHRISIRAGRFRLVDTSGVETMSPQEGGTLLDVAIVDVNEHMSKQYYSKPYDPAATEPVAPDCWSDNGAGPSDRAPNSQSASCAACPHNAWGSKVTPSGVQVKACSDLKKIAVLPVSNIGGPVHLLTVPPASLKPWRALIDTLTQRGVPVMGFAIRMGFDPAASSPKLTFVPQRWLDETEVRAISRLLGSSEVDLLVGRNDRAKPAPNQSGQGAPALPPAVQHQPQAPQAPLPAAVASDPAAPKRRGRPPASTVPPAPVAVDPNAPIVLPPVAQPVPLAMQPLVPPPGVPQHTTAAMAVPPGQMPPIPQFLDRTKDDAPGAAATPTAAPAPANLDAMLDGIMGDRS